MKDNDFRDYLKTLNYRESRIRRIIKSVSILERYLNKNDAELKNISKEILENFLFIQTTQIVTIYHSEDLARYYKFIGYDEMAGFICQLGYKYTPPVKLNTLQISSDTLKKLEKAGIKTNNQMLLHSRNQKERKQLARRISVSIEEIIKVTKLSDITRIFAVRSVRAQLYYEAGLDSVRKIAAIEPLELIEIVKDYIESSGFEGIATLPKEAEATVTNARRLPIIVVE